MGRIMTLLRVQFSLEAAINNNHWLRNGTFKLTLCVPGRAPFSGEAACGALVQNTARNDRCETVCSCLCIHQCVFDACVSLVQLPELLAVASSPPTDCSASAGPLCAGKLTGWE